MIHRAKTWMFLRRLRRATAPRREFRAGLWKRLERETLRVPRHAFRPAWMRLAPVALASFVLLASGGTGAYAYASPEVTPEHPLYPVRRGIERAEETVAFSPDAKAAARMRRMAHRLAEAERLAARDGKVDAVLAEMDREFAEADAEPRALPRLQAMRAMEKTDDKAIARLEAIAAARPDRALPAVRLLIQGDAERIRAKLERVQEPELRRFLERQLLRRRQALERVVERLEGVRGSLPSSSTPLRFERLREDLR